MMHPSKIRNSVHFVKGLFFYTYAKIPHITQLRHTVVPAYPPRICSETFSECLKLQVVLTPIYTTKFFPVHTNDKV